ncbi:MAG TPA: hypothetical protein QF469_11435 [Sphingomonas sanguinis]|uniref:hypothetical protein n=1 Tax=Sphingomonas sanguinis TaxID=33051 RepID=UPI002ABF2B32|nr:hypothetical protein [Sphingomonas sanguinis]
MTEAFRDKPDQAFSFWLRTGRLPSVLGPDGIELKFNPWHDPANGRFTFARTGRQHGTGGSDAAGGRISRRIRHTLPTGKSPVTPSPQPGTLKQRSNRPRQPNPVTEFIGGVGEGIYDVGKGTVAAVQATLTTNPMTTIRETGRGIANVIDAAIAAESTPARIQISRATSAIGNASARDVGHATGTVVGNVALSAAPGAALAKVAAVRRLRMATPRPNFDPPQIGWVKETVRSDKPWKAYNDAATGSRPSQAPTLMRTMPDGSKRPVKFDGIQGDYVIDRKWSVRDAPRARAQILRQSEVLAQHRLIGLWEVPTSAQKTKALKLLKKMNVTNIHAKVVKP